MLINTQDFDPVQTARMLNEQLLPGVEDRGVRGVPSDPERRRYPRDREPIHHQCFQPPSRPRHESSWLAAQQPTPGRDANSNHTRDSDTWAGEPAASWGANPTEYAPTNGPRPHAEHPDIRSDGTNCRR